MSEDPVKHYKKADWNVGVLQAGSLGINAQARQWQKTPTIA
ncbi:hypothetical protein ACJJID_16740 [Microbulbifer sp. CnH-101-G]